MEGSSHIEILEEADFRIRILHPGDTAPFLLLVPGGESPPHVLEALAEKLLLEDFCVGLVDFIENYEVLREGVERLLKRSVFPAIWLWGEGLGALFVLKLARDFPSQVQGLILDGLRAGDREEIALHLSGLRKPHLILHPQLDEHLPFTEVERLFILSPAHAKKLLLVPGMRRGEAFSQKTDLYVRTIAEFINPRTGRWSRKIQSTH